MAGWFVIDLGEGDSDWRWPSQTCWPSQTWSRCSIAGSPRRVSCLDSQYTSNGRNESRDCLLYFLRKNTLKRQSAGGSLPKQKTLFRCKFNAKAGSAYDLEIKSILATGLRLSLFTPEVFIIFISAVKLYWKVLLAQFSLYVHNGGLKPHSFHFISFVELIGDKLIYVPS